MNNPSTIQQLREMKFSAMAAELELQLRDPAAYAQVSFDDRFGLLVDAEWNRRQANRLKRRMRLVSEVPGVALFRLVGVRITILILVCKFRTEKAICTEF